MDGGLLGALIGVGGTAVLATIGWGVRYQIGRIRDLATKLDVAARTIENKNETIAVLRQQVSEYKITAELQSKFFGSLPPPPRPSGDR